MKRRPGVERRRRRLATYYTDEQYQKAYENFVNSKSNINLSKLKSSLNAAIKVDNLDKTPLLSDWKKYANGQGRSLIEDYDAAQGVAAAIKTCNNLNSLLQKYQELENLVAKIVNDVGKSNKWQAVYNTVSLLKTRTQNLINSGLSIESGVYFNESGNVFPSSDTSQLLKTDGSGKHSQYTSIAELRAMYSNVLAQQMGLAAEDISAKVLPGVAQGIAATKVANTLRGTLKGPSTKVLKTSIGVTIGPEEQKMIDSLSKIEGTTPLVDFSFSPNGGVVSFKVSQKQYRSLLNGSTAEIKGIDTTFRRMAIAASKNSVTTLWALIRAMASAQFQGGKSKDSSSPLRRALLNKFAYETIFGSGGDAIDAFLINGIFYTKSAVANYIMDSFKNGKTDMIYSKTGSYSIKDGYNRSTEIESIKNYIIAKEVNALLVTSYTTYWHFNKNAIQNFIK